MRLGLKDVYSDFHWNQICCNATDLPVLKQVWFGIFCFLELRNFQYFLPITKSDSVCDPVSSMCTMLLLNSAPGCTLLSSQSPSMSHVDPAPGYFSLFILPSFSPAFQAVFQISYLTYMGIFTSLSGWMFSFLLLQFKQNCLTFHHSQLVFFIFFFISS